MSSHSPACKVGDVKDYVEDEEVAGNNNSGSSSGNFILFTWLSTQMKLFLSTSTFSSCIIRLLRKIKSLHSFSAVASSGSILTHSQGRK